MTTPARCSECGAELQNAGTGEEFCPECLLRLGLSGAVPAAPAEPDPETASSPEPAPDPEPQHAPGRDAPPEGESGGPPPPGSSEPIRPSSPRLWRRVAATGFLTLALLAILVWRLPRPGPALPEARLSVETPGSADPVSLAISPDGRSIVFASESQLWVRPLASLSPRPLSGTRDAFDPFWSPDGQSIGFFADGMLKRMSLDGGPPQVLASAPLGCGGTWGPDNLILFAPSCEGPILGVSPLGGEARELGWGGESPGVGFPEFLPDGRHFLYFAGGFQGTGEIHVADLESGDTVLLLHADSAAVYASSGHLLFARQDVLLAQPFDAGRLELTGEAFPLAGQVAVDRERHVAALSVSPAGPIVYRGGSTDRRRLAWFDRAGREVDRVEVPEDVENPVLSPDGRRIAMHRTVNGNTDIWLYDTARFVMSRLTFDPEGDALAVWSPDGEQVAFRSSRDGAFGLYRKPADGSRAAEPLFAVSEGAEDRAPTDWSPDGRFIVYQTRGESSTGWDLWALPIEEGGEPFPIVQSRFDEMNGRISPDGGWVAYQSNEAGRFEIYARSFPEAQFQSQVTIGGGTEPTWSRDGSELYYLASDGVLMAVPVGGGPVLEAGVPRALFPARLGTGLRSGPGVQYAIAPDGRRFLMSVLPGEITPLTVILNWRARP